MRLWQKWFPHRVSLKKWIPRLNAYYAHNSQYHVMTAVGDKTTHPQVQLLLALIQSGNLYAEVGCGGGAVLRKVANSSRVVGMDLSFLALNQSRQQMSGAIPLVCADSSALPLRSNAMDGAYSFEVLEHVPNPLATVREMIRIIKPGGFVLLSFPHRFSLDLHCHKKRLARMLDFLCAGVRFCLDQLYPRPFRTVKPDLTDTPYPDCDVISVMNPAVLCNAMETAGCQVDFCDSTYMCALQVGSDMPLSFQRNTARPFIRHFGDHYLILAHKETRSLAQNA